MSRHRVFVALLLLAALAATVSSEREPGPSTGNLESTSTKSNYSEVSSRPQGPKPSEDQADDIYSEVEEDKLEDDEEEFEGEDEADEYEETLRVAAESHEAMSRLEKNPTNSSQSATKVTSVGTDDLEEKLRSMKKNLESREKSVEVGSDESESSNEAIGGRSLKEKDEEVDQLLKYKKMNNFESSGERQIEGVKRKRVPTVKKELSTQREVNVANETRLAKRCTTREILQHLNEALKTGQKEQSMHGGMPEINGEEVDYESASLPDAENRVSLEFDKRQEVLLRDLESYLRAEYNAEREVEQQEQRKLQELGAQEGALAESLLELLVKLAENPRRWERVHRLLMDVEGGLELSRQALETRKRALNLTSVADPTPTPPTMTSTPKKGRKKPKKKKKKPRHHHFPTTTPIIPSFPPLLTTTEAPWLTTPVQWRLVAERLFGPTWSQDLQDDASVPKVRFTVNSKPRTPSPGQDFNQQLADTKAREEHKALNTERQALMLESAREYTQPRHLHYGKMNTHLPHRDPSTSGYANDREASHIRDYDPPERSYARYRQYSQPRDYSRARTLEEDFLQPQSYAQNHEYRPSGREYAASKSWKDSQFKYGQPSWKSEEPSPWAWRQSPSDLKLWPQLEASKAWQSSSDYWSQLDDVIEDDDKPWSPRMSGPETWPVKSAWSEQGKLKDESIAPWEKSKSRPDAQNPLKQQEKNKEPGSTPKITMKTWNSLTSDPATWPFNLPGTKPWPKDKNGKSYNPNAELVRKLGLDNQGRQNAPVDFKQAFHSSSLGAYKNGKLDPKAKDMDAQKSPISWPVKLQTGKQWPEASKTFDADAELVKALSLGDGARSGSRGWSSGVDANAKTWSPKAAASPKIQSVGAWVMPADQSTWKPYSLKPMEYKDASESPERHRWSAQVDSNARTWPPKPEGQQWAPKLPETWNEKWPKWKQFAYHRVTAMPILSPGTAMDGSRARNNAYIAVSAVAPKYNNNHWRKNNIEETPVPQAAPGGHDPDHPVSQLRPGTHIRSWKKDAAPGASLQGKQNSTDQLEQQLEELRRSATWSHADNVKVQQNKMSDVSESLASNPATSAPSNSSMVSTSSNPITDKKQQISLHADSKQNKKIAEK